MLAPPRSGVYNFRKHISGFKMFAFDRKKTNVKNCIAVRDVFKRIYLVKSLHRERQGVADLIADSSCRYSHLSDLECILSTYSKLKCFLRRVFFCFNSTHYICDQFSNTCHIYINYTTSSVSPFYQKIVNKPLSIKDFK